MESLNDTIWTDEEMYDENPAPRAMNDACSISIPSCEAGGSQPPIGPPPDNPSYFGPAFWNSACGC